MIKFCTISADLTTAKSIIDFYVTSSFFFFGKCTLVSKPVVYNSLYMWHNKEGSDTRTKKKQGKQHSFSSRIYKAK